MSISYSAIKNYGKSSLPSVEDWNFSSNITKEPLKSITTRKIDKVGSNSSITQQIEESGARIMDAISYYPRGVNPAVSISYNNYGLGQGQAKLPYTIMKDGAFRPPVWTVENLAPLSRLPRVTTSAYTQPKDIRYSELAQPEHLKGTKEINITELNPTLFLKKNMQASAPQDILNFVKEQANQSVCSSHTFHKKQHDVNIDQNKYIIAEIPRIIVNSNTSGRANINVTKFNSDVRVRESPLVLRDVKSNTVLPSKNLAIDNPESRISTRVRDGPLMLMNVKSNTVLPAKNLTIDDPESKISMRNNLRLGEIKSNIMREKNTLQIDSSDLTIKINRNSPRGSIPTNKNISSMGVSSPTQNPDALNKILKDKLNISMNTNKISPVTTEGENAIQTIKLRAKIQPLFFQNNSALITQSDRQNLLPGNKLSVC